MSVLNFFISTTNLSNDKFLEVFKSVSDKLKMDIHKVGIKEIMENRIFLTDKVDVMEKRTKGYKFDIFEENSETINLMNGSETETDFGRIFYKIDNMDFDDSNEENEIYFMRMFRDKVRNRRNI